MTSIPSLIEGHDVISDAKEKANLLNEYFASQSTVDDSSAALPDDSDFYQFKLRKYYPILLLLKEKFEIYF